MYTNPKFKSNERISELEKIMESNTVRHDLILEIYKDVKKALKDLKIDHVLFGGSALGAHLYKDFIPWDDDLDIAIKQEDRKKFVSEIEKYLPDNYKLVAQENGDWNFMFMKIINTNYEIFSEGSELPEYSRYLWIDVTSVISTSRATIPFRLKKWGHLLFARNADQGKFINALKTPIKVFSTAFINKQVNRLMKRYENGNGFSMEQTQTRNHNDLEIDFDNPTIEEFRGIKAPLPNNIEAWLTQNFKSDYYKLPEKLITHHYEIIDKRK